MSLPVKFTVRPLTREAKIATGHKFQTFANDGFPGWDAEMRKQVKAYFDQYVYSPQSTETDEIKTLYRSAYEKL